MRPPSRLAGALRQGDVLRAVVDDAGVGGQRLQQPGGEGAAADRLVVDAGVDARALARLPGGAVVVRVGHQAHLGRQELRDEGPPELLVGEQDRIEGDQRRQRWRATFSHLAVAGEEQSLKVTRSVSVPATYITSGLAVDADRGLARALAQRRPAGCSWRRAAPSRSRRRRRRRSARAWRAAVGRERRVGRGAHRVDAGRGIGEDHLLRLAGAVAGAAGEAAVRAVDLEVVVVGGLRVSVISTLKGRKAERWSACNCHTGVLLGCRKSRRRWA